ncbi:hypothetical protein NSP_20330 [Nodularia spumigena CCY9414]|nr:hypothetical protein NSP_20330 [Nodularia spumigena CCY9414]
MDSESDKQAGEHKGENNPLFPLILLVPLMLLMFLMLLMLLMLLIFLITTPHKRQKS